MQLIKRKVPFVPSYGGHKRMALLEMKSVLELGELVDVFISPNDQMGVQRPFVDVVSKYATKPLIGIGKHEVTQRWGATMSIFPSMESAGYIAANMILRLYRGEDFNKILPRHPDNGIAVGMSKMKKFGIDLSGTFLSDPSVIVVQ